MHRDDDAPRSRRDTRRNRTRLTKYDARNVRAVRAIDRFFVRDRRFERCDIRPGKCRMRQIDRTVENSNTDISIAKRFCLKLGKTRLGGSRIGGHVRRESNRNAGVWVRES